MSAEEEHALLVVVHCYECQIPYGLLRSYHAQRVADGKNHACPNGHHWHYVETDADRQRRRADRAEQNLEMQRRRAQYAEESAAQLGRIVRALRGVVTKLKRGRK